MQFIMSLTIKNGEMPFLSGKVLCPLQVDWVQVSAITPGFESALGKKQRKYGRVGVGFNPL